MLAQSNDLMGYLKELSHHLQNFHHLCISSQLSHTHLSARSTTCLRIDCLQSMLLVSVMTSSHTVFTQPLEFGHVEKHAFNLHQGGHGILFILEGLLKKFKEKTSREPMSSGFRNF